MARCPKCCCPDKELTVQSNGYETCFQCAEEYEKMIDMINSPTKKRETKIITLSTPT